MKHFFSTLFVVFFATSLMAQSGLTCDDPIPVDSNYVGYVKGPCTLWYTAWTYDLPLKVNFTPDIDDSTWGPEVQVDFTCTPGKYDDPKLDSLLTMVEDFGVSFPVEFMCDLITPNGKNEWELSINKNYREQLAEYGITYNVQAFVKVTFFESGKISLRPDTSFISCIENTQYVKLGDTLDVAANDTEKAYIFPYTDWQNDSIRFVWLGEGNARVYLAHTDCEFIPEEDNGFVWAYYDITQDSPKKVFSSQMKDAIKQHKNGGLFYSKVVSPNAGRLVVEKIPMAQTQGGAIVMEKGKAINLEANDTTTLYCFPRTWKGMYFSTTTSSEILMYTSPSYDFGIAQSKGAWRRVFPFDIENGRRALYVSNAEMKVVTDKAIDDYIYVRFVCAAQTTIIAEDWEQSECAGQSTLIRPNASVTVLARSSNTIFRMRYADWEGYDITINWSGNSTLPVYIADACDFTLASNNAHVLQYASVDRKGKFTIPASSVNSWSSRVDEDGFLYVRFNPTNQGAATFATDKPEPVPTPDPIYTTESATICYGESYEWNGTTYTETGKYTYTTVAANGADSIVTLDLTVYPQTEATTENVEVAYGETYTWNGTTYTESGEYTITLQDENGCDYQATLVLTILPEEKPENPCVAVSTLLEPVAQLTLNLGDAFDIYRIDYQAWLASGVNLVWTGKGALHTFVAKDCEFAVAVHHQDVVNYTEVPAEGSVVLSKTILAGLAHYVDADGYLYVRFLTELEGLLTTTLAE